MSAALVVIGGLAFIAFLLGVLAITFYLIWWVVMIAVSFIPMIGKRHRHRDWDRANRGEAF